jgi:hypothetical protein
MLTSSFFVYSVEFTEIEDDWSLRRLNFLDLLIFSKSFNNFTFYRFLFLFVFSFFSVCFFSTHAIFLIFLISILIILSTFFLIVAASFFDLLIFFF